MDHWLIGHPFNFQIQILTVLKSSMISRGQFHKLVCALFWTVCTLCQTVPALPPTFETLFTGVKVQPKAQKIGLGRKTVYEIDPQFKPIMPIMTKITFETSSSSQTVRTWISFLSDLTSEALEDSDLKSEAFEDSDTGLFNPCPWSLPLRIWKNVFYLYSTVGARNPNAIRKPNFLKFGFRMVKVRFSNGSDHSKSELMASLGRFIYKEKKL